MKLLALTGCNYLGMAYLRYAIPTKNLPKKEGSKHSLHLHFDPFTLVNWVISQSQ